jgi:hypothetical protein
MWRIRRMSAAQGCGACMTTASSIRTGNKMGRFSRTLRSLAAFTNRYPPALNRCCNHDFVEPADRLLDTLIDAIADVEALRGEPAT